MASAVPLYHESPVRICGGTGAVGSEDRSAHVGVGLLSSVPASDLSVSSPVVYSYRFAPRWFRPLLIGHPSTLYARRSAIFGAGRDDERAGCRALGIWRL